MQVSVETTQGLERRLTIRVPSDKIDTEVENRLKRLVKTQRVDGFRPGKAPVAVIRKRFGAALRDEVAFDVAQRSFIEAVIAEKLNPAGTPTLQMLANDAGKDLEFTATVEIYPEFEVQGLDSLAVDKPVASVVDGDVDAMIETLRQQQAKWQQVERAAADGDRLIIDFSGSLDGVEFEGGKAEGFSVVLGAGRMIPGFEAALVGKKAGDSFVAPVTFPADYHAEHLKGKAADFAMTVKQVEGRVLPEVDAEFIKTYGVAEATVEALRAEVRRNMERELRGALKNQTKESVIEALLGANAIEVPKALVDQEVDSLRQQAVERFGGGRGGKLPELPREIFAEQAERRVRIGLVLGQFIRQSDLKVDEARVEAILNEVAGAYEDPADVISYYRSQENLMQSLRNLALEDQAIDAVLAKAKVNEVAKAFSDVVNSQRNG